MKFRLTLFTLFICCYSLIAQQKFEREVRIDPSDVPQSAIKFVKELNLDSKIKWYKETGLNSSSYEAKTKSKGKKYSIEFNTEGTLEDIEIVISKKQLSKEVLQKIKDHLKENLSKFKLGKIQIQYSGDIKAVTEKITSNISSDGLIVRYELIVSARLDKKFQKFEYLFSDSGDFIQRQNIILQNTDNLEY